MSQWEIRSAKNEEISPMRLVHADAYFSSKDPTRGEIIACRNENTNTATINPQKVTFMPGRTRVATRRPMAEEPRNVANLVITFFISWSSTS